MEDTSKQEKMFSLVEEYTKGEQPLKKICETHAITKDSFRYWINKYKSLSTEPVKGFVPVKITACNTAVQTITITYPNKVKITVGENVKLEFIKSLISMV